MEHHFSGTRRFRENNNNNKLEIRTERDERAAEQRMPKEMRK